MRHKILIVFLVIFSIKSSVSRRHSRKSDTLEDWQKRALEKIQVIAREGGLPEAEWKAITKYDKDVCYSKPCLQSALEVVEATNFTVDPCQPNMWLEFVCGRRVNDVDNINHLERATKKVQARTKEILDHGLPEGKGDNFLLKEAQVFYHQCLHKAHHDKEDVKQILSFLSENYGEWPMISNRDPGPRFDWLNMVADLNRIERPGFIPQLLKVGSTHTSQLVQLDIGKTSSPITVTDFNAMMVRIQEYTGEKRPARLEQLSGILQFVANVGALTSRRVMTEYLTIDELQKKTDELFEKREAHYTINWLDFFQRVFNGSNIEITGEDPIITVPFDNVKRLLLYVNDQFAKNKTQSVANALNFQFATVLLQETTALLDDLNSFKCTDQTGTRDQICFARTTETFGYSLGRTYLSVHYDKDTETPAILDMMKQIKQGYIDAVESYEWMENSTKEYLKDKILNIHTFVTQPEWTKNPKKLKKFYTGLQSTISKDKLYPQNYLTVANWRLAKMRSWAWKMSHVTKIKDLNFYDIEWSAYLGDVNAQYHFVLNEVRILGGIVQSPIFSAKRPGFMNYGGLGTVLGHEIGHSFDPAGRMYNKHGEGPREFWDPKSVEMYKKWTDTILEDAGSEAHQISDSSAETLNPNSTLNENVADILGIYIGYNSYQDYLKELESEGKQEKILPGLKSFSPQKLFFMKYANMWCNKKGVQDRFNDLFGKHSPGNTRATLPLKRSKEFAETFGCPLPEESKRRK